MPRDNVTYARLSIEIGDARTLSPEEALDREGFELVRHETSVSNLHDPESARKRYFPERIRQLVGAEEAILIKCYASDEWRTCFTAHSAFDDPTSPGDAAPRDSIEVRSIAFFQGIAG